MKLALFEARTTFQPWAWPQSWHRKQRWGEIVIALEAAVSESPTSRSCPSWPRVVGVAGWAREVFRARVEQLSRARRCVPWIELFTRSDVVTPRSCRERGVTTVSTLQMRWLRHRELKYTAKFTRPFSGSAASWAWAVWVHGIISLYTGDQPRQRPGGT